MKHSLKLVRRILSVTGFLAAAVFAAQAQNGTLRFSSASYSAKESVGAAKITVTRTGGSAGTVSVDFTTLIEGGGTAVAEADFYPTNGTLTFGPGVTSQFFYVPIIEDETHEDPETIFLLLNTVTGGAALGLSDSVLTLTDDDACSYAISPASQILDSAGGLAPTVIVTATEGCDWTVVETVPWISVFTGGGNGPGQVEYSFDPNPGSSPRKATIKIAGKTLSITQLGVPPPDTTPPTITFVSPAAGSRQTNDTITVTGRATDNVAVTLVEARLENEAGISDYIVANGTANWSVSLAGLVPGTNTIRIRARDAENVPVEATRSVVFVEVAPLSLPVVGEGTVTPLRDAQLLDVGASYTALARPAAKHFFTGWSGTIESAANPLTFQMQPGFVLRANFVPTPFRFAAGNYSGLCVEPEAIRQDSSGSLTFKVTDLGAYSAKLVLGGKRHSLSGTFTLDGLATNIITRPGTNSLTLLLAIDLTGANEQITGNLTDGSWTASVLCDRAVFNPGSNPAPQAGRYTWVLPGDDEDADEKPAGYSFGTVTVDAAGGVKFAGTLADGTKVSQKAPLSKAGWCPIYLPLYGGNGSILSWLIFAESPEADFTGVMNWVKPPLPAAKIHPAGFAVQHELSGARYTPTNNLGAALGFTEGKAGFSAGNLAADFENGISVTNNRVLNLGDNKLTLSVTLSSGLFKGTVTVPGTTRSIPFQGAMHSKQDNGWGFFLGTNQSGRVRLSP